MDAALPLPAANDEPGSNVKRCSPGCHGVGERSKPPSEPTPLPRPISSIGGITARGMPAPTGAGVMEAREEAGPVHWEELPGVWSGVAVPAATAKLAIGRAFISACRMASRAAS